MWRRLWAPFFLVCFVAVGLAGCAARPSVLSETLSALWAQSGSGAGAAALPTSPDPRYRYLRVEVQDRPPALMVLGYADPDSAGEIETWYSANREVIKTQNGRIVSTAGLETDWVAVRYPLQPPSWDAIPPNGVAVQRQRDVMPGYAYGLDDVLWVTPLGLAPAGRLPTSLPVGIANTYRWFRQDARSAAGEALPSAWFAWGKHRGMLTIVYSEQCLSASLCLKMQRWPMSEGEP
jgi:Group 4 capsule polysaccharide lipoprotein gfcB, YjbF